MTTEELLAEASYVDEVSCEMIYLSDLEEFLNTNVCIPKGENPHPDANILHMVAENYKLVIEAEGGKKVWFETCFFNTINRFRLPLENNPPKVHEYKWFIGTLFGFRCVTETYLTKEEVAEGKYDFQIIEETKRLRQEG